MSTRSSVVRWSSLVQSAALLACWAAPAFAAPVDTLIRQEISVTLRPSTGTLLVEDTVTLPTSDSTASGRFRFQLRNGDPPTVLEGDVAIRRLPDDPGADVVVGPTEGERHHVERYEVVAPSGVRRFRIRYERAVQNDLSSDRVEPAFGVLTPGVVFLDGRTSWYPVFGDGLVRATVEIRAPRGWEAISQGAMTGRRLEKDEMVVRWESAQPQDEIYVVGGPLTAYTSDRDGIAAMVYLRAPDPDLAATYLEATHRYLSLYRELIGRYPYPKFAMVENLWETGYGMPSFTLLGSRVIRLPFILTTSYPHEILHNWWGNGVFVDSRDGNWAEGLTAYLADHLFAESKGAGAAYRRAALQQYADYVSRDRDFPLTAFRERHDPASQAVGYGKALMAFHMVRRELGDARFLSALRSVYERFRFRHATFADLDRAFADAAGASSGGMRPWIERVGAPEVAVGPVNVVNDPGGGYRLSIGLEQRQTGEAFPLNVPVAVTMDGRERAFQTTVRLDTKHTVAQVVVPSRPVRLDVDPEFDLFRRVDQGELPVSLSRLFGAANVSVVLPSAAPSVRRLAYQRLGAALTSHADDVDVVWDDTIERLPADRELWVLGWENRFRDEVAARFSEASVRLGKSVATVDGVSLDRTRSAVVLTGETSGSWRAVGWVGCDLVEALDGLARKLPHYGKYGYLAFEGTEPTNSLKGEWTATRSPLTVFLTRSDGETRLVPRGRLEERGQLSANGSLPPPR